MVKYVYSFEEAKGIDDRVFVLGNKGAQLAEMAAIGLQVPHGFTITTKACIEFYTAGQKWPKDLEKQVEEKIKELESKAGKQFGSTENPLLVSIRSGSYVSMPGMMDTVLNLGLSDSAVEGFAEKTNNPRLAWDSYRRFVQMFSDVVLGIDHGSFEEILEKYQKKCGAKCDADLSADDLKKIVASYKKFVKEKSGKEFPQNPKEQLVLAISAVFNSWNNKRAVTYRKIQGLRDDAGTGVTVQTMVFGNTGNRSGTGVGFTRNPATGEKEHYGEFLINAQGEDVVAGIRTPEPLTKLKDVFPKAYEQLAKNIETLEKHYRDVQDFEFTVEEGKLYMLQTRTAKRTATAAVKSAVDMVNEGLINNEEGVMRIDPKQINQLLHKQIDPKAKKSAKALAKGLAASPGAAVGQVIFDADKAAKVKEDDPNAKIILVRRETSPEDIAGMNAAQGILTSRGGLTSHAAIVARGMGKCCVVGCESLTVDPRGCNFATPDGKRIREKDWITIDGGTGEIFKGRLDLVEPTIGQEFAILMGWADGFRKLGVRTNADTPKDSKVARDFGAEGIGLCRTEHMFFEADRITAMRRMILSATKEAREKALAQILPMQKQDFIGIFKAMDGLPVTIRLLDPPLHEFLPHNKKEMVIVATQLGIDYEEIKRTVRNMQETNPMLGFRGCRLGLVYPEINEMQVRAIMEAACECKKKGIDVKPEIMVPVLQHVNEMKILREVVDRVAKKVLEEQKCEVEYLVGVMMELPRACLTADAIAEYAEFFSFGTNDLTQTTLGFSRDDVGKFIPQYIEMKIMPFDPFQRIDENGVGELVKVSVERGRKKRKGLKIGICGEHGGEPHSVEFCHRTGLDYVSCSPFRVPIARLAAAQAALREKQQE